MKVIAFAVCFFLWSGCESSSDPLVVQNFDPLLARKNGIWVYHGAVFNGTMVEKDRTGKLLYQVKIVDGKEEGLALGMYNTGEKLLARKYSHGKKSGRFLQWWPNGHVRYSFGYKEDKMDGQQLVFYPDGKTRQESNYANGVEEGIQRVWNENGALVSNYTIRNKKLYGVISVKSCLPAMH
jgi:antitoxin component YwqK of YwqJK toxin-antitoxin module